jgi:hypothetical protein
MKISIVRKAKLDNIASASGVEVVDGMIYLLSDDSSYLYKIKHDLTLLEKIALYKSSSEDPEHIAKPEKADLECMGQLSINGYKHLLLLGSGSRSPQRDKGFLVKLPSNYTKKHFVTEVQLGGLFNLLRSHDEITVNGEINLEGLAFGNEKTYLLNRGNPSGIKNAVLSFDKPEFIEFIQGHSDGVPFPSIHPVNLPELSGVKTGFSGADFFDNRFWFTCSAEETSNAYDDGSIKGSMIGLLEVDLKSNGRFTEEKIRLQEITSFFEEGELFIGKIESVSVYEKDSEGVYTALAVTDNDGKPSELLLLDIRL